MVGAPRVSSLASVQEIYPVQFFIDKYIEAQNIVPGYPGVILLARAEPLPPQFTGINHNLRTTMCLPGKNQCHQAYPSTKQNDQDKIGDRENEFRKRRTCSL